jgi:hypothetical protein
MALTDVTLTGPFTDARQVSPIITALVLGQPALPGAADLFFPRVPVPAPVFQLRQYDLSEFVAAETQRAFSAPYKFEEMTGVLKEASLKRYSFAGRADVDQIKIATGVGGDPKFQMRRAAIGKRKVDLTREVLAADILSATGTYPAGHTLAISAGSEWNAAGGDSQTDISTASDAILSKTAAARDTLYVGLSSSAFNAALQDPVFKAQRVYTSAAFPGEEDLRRYWGVAKVFHFNPIRSASPAIGTVPTSIYSDIAIVYVPTLDAPNFDAENGGMVFGAGFSWNTGVANVPFYDNMTSSWYYPWTDWFDLEVISNGSGFLITNCAA